MPTAELQELTSSGITHDAIREQLETLVQDSVFRSSKRSVQFLRYVVERTLEGSADQIKERTIGTEVFGRSPSYDTNSDHVVRTAAIELRKRLAIYYGDERHRSELRMSLVPGSYVPHFSLPAQAVAPAELDPAHEAASHAAAAQALVASEEDPPPSPLPGPARPIAPVHALPVWFGAVAAAAVLLGILAYHLRPRTAQELFWQPLTETPGSVLLAVGSVPNGPPSPSESLPDPAAALPIISKGSSPSVPFADAMTIARVTGALESRGKRVVIRREEASSFSELRESPVVLVGAFNNEWSLRLTQRLRYSLALDPAAHLIYIRDARHPEVRNWAWATNQPAINQGAAGRPPLEDYALISRIWNSDTGRVVVVIGGLYTYGTETAGEFLGDPQLMQSVAKAADLKDSHRNLQIVLGTKVTDDTAGPPRVLAVSTE